MILSKIYIDDVYQGETSGTTWDVSEYAFEFDGTYTWRVDTYDTTNELTTTGDDWLFTVKKNFPEDRPDDYDPTLIYATDGVDPDSLNWSDPYDFPIERLGGGRYKKQILAIGTNSKIYYGAIE
ncbi:MAG: hypothetical protein WC451_03150 [Patescibacteria group bacterium]|jgi:hypothetical protein